MDEDTNNDADAVSAAKEILRMVVGDAKTSSDAQ